MTLNFQKINITDVAIQTAKDSIPGFVENIDTFEGTNDNFYIRVKFKKLDLYAYIVIDTKNSLMVHYCENVEKNLSCKHRNILAAIANHYRYSIELANTKTKLVEYKDFVKRFEKVKWENKDDEFNLFPSISDSTTVQTPEVKNAVIVHTQTIDRDWAAGWNEVQDYLDKQGVDIALQIKILERRKQISKYVPIQPEQSPPLKPKTPYQGEIFRRVLRHIFNNKHLILIGGKGAGKDTLINTIAWIFNLPKLLQIGDKDTSRESIVAEPAFRNNQSTYDLSQFTKTVQMGGLVNYAEVNFLKGDTTSVFHSLFDDNETLATPIGPIHAHKEFLMCCSMNVGNGYFGVNKLNDAFKDRFAVIRLPQTLSFETLIKDKSGLEDSSAIKFLSTIKKNLEELFFDNLCESADTIRGYIDAAVYFLNYGFNNETRIEVVEDYIINKVEDIEDYFEARNAVREAFAELKLQAFPLTEEEKAYSNSDTEEN
ncbi:AAA family ATPase [Lysinibacillus sp. UGB7]|uniref:AAA family ATPase n=1 Tax=Lysinibacillus sp. UGB7 TaxID=3411039 RepID=UPI003B7F93F9